MAMAYCVAPIDDHFARGKLIPASTLGVWRKNSTIAEACESVPETANTLLVGCADHEGMRAAGVNRPLTPTRINLIQQVASRPGTVSPWITRHSRSDDPYRLLRSDALRVRMCAGRG